MNSRKNAARVEKLQRRVDAGFVATHFPEVASIVISMTYNQRGIAKSLPRTVNFFPDSYALFRVDCLSKECVDGGFDLTRVITGMIRNHKVAAKGDLCCEGNGSSADHSAIVYEVAIQYI
ncbi:MAG TPA: hypothetical protein VMU21_11950 [Thermodesulfovibrionales bacterium]|nr:hypothetical protein [Thermodesulfovibrionales bacterium]